MNVQVVWERAERVVPNWSQSILAGPKLWSAGLPNSPGLGLEAMATRAAYLAKLRDPCRCPTSNPLPR